MRIVFPRSARTQQTKKKKKYSEKEGDGKIEKERERLVVCVRRLSSRGNERRNVQGVRGRGAHFGRGREQHIGDSSGISSRIVARARHTAKKRHFFSTPPTISRLRTHTHTYIYIRIVCLLSLGDWTIIRRARARACVCVSVCT